MGVVVHSHGPVWGAAKQGLIRISNFLGNRPDFNIPNIDDFNIFVFANMLLAVCLHPPFACAHNKWTRFKFQTGNVYSFGRWTEAHCAPIGKEKIYSSRNYAKLLWNNEKNFHIIYLQKRGGGLSCTCFVINHDEFDELCSVCLVSKTKHKLLMVVAKYGKP